ncbi:putative UDP-glucosyl transferase 72E1 [Hibiscus syriacus]|uniref:Glycosyltransferase n=1 Tax=Hibiscus syriacus TaxID=106335 RepID=A0A6A2Z240_HIBSY|nr:UDP-glycosyltransferase 72E1-like [Hibiscus syriacus]KAE8685994.1 putative UDP-glucosyl transferase 72E1 [Hibiscus syriacus]
MESTMPHIALLASPGMGHLIPVLELAQRLVSHQSFKVTLFVVSTDHASITNTQLLQSLADSDDDGDLLDIVLVPFVDVSDIVGPGVSFVDQIVVAVLRSLPFLKTEISKMESPPSALVVDMFGTSALGIADDFNMLKFVFVTSNARLFSVMLCTPEMDRKEIDEHVKNQTPLNIPGCKPLKFEDTFEVFFMDPSGPSYQGFIDAVIKMSLSDGILVNTWDELEPFSLKALKETKKAPIYPVGPLVRPTKKSVLCNEIIDWLDKQPKESVIYVSFGSGGTLSTQQVIELAWGLELSQQRFVWVARPPIENDAAGNFLALGNGSDGTLNYLPEGFSARTQDLGLVIPMWAPQVEILSHPSIGGFLTHGGWNSALESIINGVPMIVWPLYSEQKMNADILTEDIGASIRVTMKPDRVVGREEIRSMVSKIMIDHEGRNIRTRIKELKNSATKAVVEGGSSYTSLSQLAEICIQRLKTKAYGA